MKNQKHTPEELKAKINEIKEKKDLSDIAEEFRIVAMRKGMTLDQYRQSPEGRIMQAIYGKF